ncbi:MAG TPA: pyridoxamine 5'-phosphate oxidase family protein [Prosthecobacter sp.]|nr:pyridoxamine 5'-phosphate oxidase family protein [Prosthecobacter sp.]
MSPNSATPEQRGHFLKLLKDFSTAMLVTHAGADQLRARPMAIADIESSGRVWFITSVDTAKVHEIVSDTRVHLVCQKEHSAYLSISGRASLERDRAKLDQVWQEPFKVWFPRGKDDPEIALIAVTPEEVEFWDNQGFNRISYLFESAKAYVSGTKPDIKEGEEHAFVKL